MNDPIDQVTDITRPAINSLYHTRYQHNILERSAASVLLAVGTGKTATHYSWRHCHLYTNCWRAVNDRVNVCTRCCSVLFFGISRSFCCCCCWLVVVEWYFAGYLLFLPMLPDALSAEQQIYKRSSASSCWMNTAGIRTECHDTGTSLVDSKPYIPPLLFWETPYQYVVRTGKDHS